MQTPDVTARPRPRRRRVVEASLGMGLRASYALAPRWTLEAMADRLCEPGNASRRKPAAACDCGAAHRDVQVDDRRLTLHVWGDPCAQPYALASHGWRSGGHRFAAWAPALAAEGLALVAVDQPAHGRSGGRRATIVDFACTLLAVAHKLGPPVALIGHSLGGLAAIVALGEGLNASRAVLVATPSDLATLLSTRLASLRLPGALEAGLSARFEQEACLPLSQLGVEHYAHCLASPALVVHDEHDGEVSFVNADRIARHWPTARLLRTQGLGHHRILSNPDVVQASARWIAGR